MHRDIRDRARQCEGSRLCDVPRHGNGLNVGRQRCPCEGRANRENGENDQATKEGDNAQTPE
jgi:hypothetical protein